MSRREGIGWLGVEAPTAAGDARGPATLLLAQVDVSFTEKMESGVTDGCGCQQQRRCATSGSRSAPRATGVPVRPGMHVRVVSVELTRTPGEGAGEAPSVLAVFQARAWRTFPCFILDPAGNPVL